MKPPSTPIKKAEDRRTKRILADMKPKKIPPVNTPEHWKWFFGGIYEN